MLQIAVERDDDLALCFIEARCKRRRLAEITAQAEHFQMMISLNQVRQQIETPVSGGIVDEDDLVGTV